MSGGDMPDTDQPASAGAEQPSPTAGDLPHTSLILADLAQDLSVHSVPISFILAELRTRAYGALTFVLALAGMLPGISVIAGIVMILIAIQLVGGRAYPVLPKAIASRRIPVRKLKKWIDRIVPWLIRIERFVKPRYRALSGRPMRIVTGIVLIGLGLALLVPLPFSQLAPGLAGTIISVALLERDGPWLIAGLLFGVGAIALAVFLLGVVVRLAGLVI